MATGSDGKPTPNLASGSPKPPEELAHFGPGDVVNGRYELEQLLGQGGMGRVFVARRLDSVQEQVALKLITHPRDFPRFEAEARIIARLRHPNTVRLIEFGGLGGGRAYLAMELLEGRTLAAALRTGDLSPRRGLEIAREVSLSLAEAHAYGIVHRDIKPSNIFLQRSDHREYVRVLDFGVARRLVPDVTARDGITVDGEFIGTPAFASPEQCRGEAVSPASDLYALGLIIFRSVLGRHPLEAWLVPPIRCVHAHVNQPIAIPRAELDDWPGLADLLESLLEKEPSDRLGRAEALADALESILATSTKTELDPPDAPGHAPAPTSLPRTRPRFTAVLGGLFIALSVIALVATFSRPSRVTLLPLDDTSSNSSSALPPRSSADPPALPRRRAGDGNPTSSGEGSSSEGTPRKSKTDVAKEDGTGTIDVRPLSSPPPRSGPTSESRRSSARWMGLVDISASRSRIELEGALEPWKALIERCARRFSLKGVRVVVRVGKHAHGTSLILRAPDSGQLQRCLDRGVERRGQRPSGQLESYFEAELRLSPT